MTAEDADGKYYTGTDGTVSLKCDKCAESLGSMKEWASHQFNVHQLRVGGWSMGIAATKSGTRLLPCPICWKSVNVPSLPGHIVAVHTKDFPFVCSHCGKGYVAEKHLASHVQGVHGGGLPKRFLCLLCGDAFITKGNLYLILFGKYQVDFSSIRNLGQ
jgi:uncharacterized C2H2 Zn-finger protein